LAEEFVAKFWPNSPKVAEKGPKKIFFFFNCTDKHSETKKNFISFRINPLAEAALIFV
jgi:hypothetical protein